ncbi:MAG: PH domain-containing protein [Balneolaceae bacterium]|nr:PH domain-containing protein [Balneolaceae bacterium]
MSEFRRQHPIAAVTQLFVVIRQNIVPFIIFVVLGSRNSGEYFWLIVLLGIIVTFVLGVVGWFRFTFRVREDELQINKGIFVRKKLYLSKDRIQVIDITEGLIQRMFGLVKVEIKTAGGGTEKATISAITRSDAVQLRTLLREKEVQRPAESESLTEISGELENTVVSNESNKIWVLSNRDLFYAALTSGNFGVIASILGALSGQLDQFITEENMDYIFGLLPGFSQLTVILWSILFILLISYLLSFIGVILRYGDFKIEKKEKELQITSGLLERKQLTVPFDRVQAFRFVEGVLRQPFGYGMLYVESAGFEQKENDRSIVVLPFVKRAKLSSFLEEFMDEAPDESTCIVPPKRSLFRYIRQPNYLLLIVIPVLWIFFDWAWMLSALVIPFSLFGWLEYKDAKIEVAENTVLMQFRNLARTTAIVKINRAQVSEISMNPFQRRKHLATVSITAASGAGGKSFTVDDLDANDAERLLKWPIARAS